MTQKKNQQSNPLFAQHSNKEQAEQDEISRLADELLEQEKQFAADTLES